MSRFSLGVAAAVSLAAITPSQSPIHAVPLFAPIPHLADPWQGTFPEIEQGVPVALDLQLLYSCREGDLLRFPAFDGITHDLRVREREMLENFPGAFHLHCDTIAGDFGHAVLTVVGDRVAATVQPADLAAPVVHLQPTIGGLTCLREIRVPDDFCGCGAGSHTNPRRRPTADLSGEPRVAGSTTCGDPSVITLMICYDATSFSRIGSEDSARALALNGAALMTTALQDGGLQTQIQVTSVRFTTYADDTADMTLHLSRISGGYGVGLEDALNWRRDEGADLAMLIVGVSTALTAGGIGYLPENDSEFRPENGFSVVTELGIVSRTFLHELGHNFGCQHDPNAPQGNLYRSYGQGYVDRYVGAAPFEQRYARTIMAYEPTCGAINCIYKTPFRFSQAGLTGQDGRRTYSLGSANHDNMRLIRETIGKIAEYSDAVARAPAFTQQPTNIWRCPGAQSEPLIFEALADRAVDYEWLKRVNGNWVSTGVRNAAFTLSDITASDFGRYRVRATGCNGLTSLSNVVQLYQRAGATVTSHPSDVTRDAGAQTNPRIMTVAANNAVSHQWYKQDSQGQFQPVAGQATNALTLPTVECEDAGIYMCRLTGQCGIAVDSNPALLTVGPQGEWISYGMGCAATGLDIGSTFYERFGGFDLHGRALRYAPTRSGWRLDSAEGAFDSAYAGALGLGDDQLSRNHALGFSFPMPGGASTTVIDVDSNGWVGLISGQFGGSQYSEDAGRFLNGPARIAVLWDDLNPGGGGEVFFDAFPDRALVTWVGIPRFRDPRPSTFQLQLFPDGSFVLAYGTVAVQDCLVGYSEGNGVLFPDVLDLSSGPSGAPVLLPGVDLPAIGESVSMRAAMSDRAGTPTLLLGFTQLSLDLTLIGMPGCSQLNTGNVTLPMNDRGFAADITFGLPDNPQLVGREIYAQAVLFEPGANAFGVLMSNGLTLRFGACR